MKSSKGSLLNAVFLVSGTSIGAGMLAQPIAAGLAAFVPTVVIMILAWFFMTGTALVLAEVCLVEKEDTHIFTLAGKYLGNKGKFVTGFIFCFIAYGSTTAYISAGGDLLSNLMGGFAGIFYGPKVGSLLFVIVFGAIIKLSSDYVGKFNTLLFIGVVVSYFYIVGKGVWNIEPENLYGAHWNKALLVLPLFFTSFSFQMIVPSLCSYLNHDAMKLRLAIVLGTSFSLIIYLIWNAVVLGATPPHMINRLSDLYNSGGMMSHIFDHGGNLSFKYAVEFFSFCAVVTSFIGISWSLIDFFADALRKHSISSQKMSLWLLVMVPPLLIAVTYPGIFVNALEMTGGYGDSILNGIIPILMLLVVLKSTAGKKVPKFVGNPALIATLSFIAVLGLVIETCNHLGIFSLGA